MSEHQKQADLPSPARAQRTEVRPVRLTFETDLEDAFVRHYFDQHLRYRRWVLVVAMLLYLGNAVADYRLVPSGFETALAFRVLGTVTLSIVFALSFLNLRPRTFDRLLSAGALGVGVFYVGIIWTVPTTLDHLYQYGVFPIVMAIYTVMRIRFWYAVFTSLFISAALLLAGYDLGLAGNLIENLWSNLIPVNFLGISAAYAMERYDRSSFRKSTLLERSRQSLEAEIRKNREAAKELEKAKLQAEAANQAKSAFLAKMSHEIRTPMNGVIGMNELLLASELTEAQKELAGTVRDSGQALLQVINDILDFSKIEADRMKVESRPFDLQETVAAVVRLLQVQAKAKDLALDHVFAAPTPAWVMGDGGRLRQVLLNLIGNALKFTEKGSVSVRVRLQASDRYTIQVEDTGPGIAADKQAQLFDPFEQLEDRSRAGTGLGLAISRQLVTLMGGELELESAPGEGSTFRFTLPLEAAASQPTAPASNIAPKLEGRPKVLVAEDNRVNQAVIRGLLQHLGCDSVIVEDGEEAVNAAASEVFDAILMDLQMPRLNGIEAAKQVRLTDAGRTLPIIALTASTSDETKEACLAAGMNDYLTKPIESAALFGKLQSVLAPHA